MGQIKTRCSAAAGLFLILLTVIAGFSSCKSNQKDIIPSAEYAPYVNAYTGGVISQNSTIRIELTQDQPMVDLNQELKDNPFSFSPSLKGKTYWVSNNTIEFVPEEGALKPGAFYEGTFHLGDFVDVDKKLEEFNFSFRVQERNFSIHTDPIPTTASSGRNLPPQTAISILPNRSRTCSTFSCLLEIDSFYAFSSQILFCFIQLQTASQACPLS